MVAESSKKKSSDNLPKDIVKGSVLAHVEHMKTVGEAFSKAGETYKSKHDASEKEDGWVKDLPKNLFEGVKDLHGSLFESPKKAFDVFSSATK